MEVGFLVLALACAAPAGAGHVLVDLAGEEILEALDPDAAIESGKAADLLLAEVVRERLAHRAVTPASPVPLLVVAGDRGPRVEGRGSLELGELLQLWLLTGSRSAARSLAAAVGPGPDGAVARMRHAARRLAVARTTLPDEWPPAQAGTGEPRGRRTVTTTGDLARLGMALAGDEDLRRRLALDGVPIADGSLIVRASAPLIAVGPDVLRSHPVGSSAAEGDDRAALTLGERDGLALLAVATGPHASAEAHRVLARGFARYERVSLVRAGQPVGREITVRGGILPRFTAVAAETLTVTATRGAPAPFAIRLQLPAAVEAPVEVDQAVGELVIERDRRLFAVVPLVAPVSIAPSRWLDTAQQ